MRRPLTMLSTDARLRRRTLVLVIASVWGAVASPASADAILQPTQPGSEETASLEREAERLWILGEHALAEPLVRRLLELRERQLGAGHEKTIEALNNLAVLLFTTGREDEAEPIYRKVLSASELTFGSDSSKAGFYAEQVGDFFARTNRGDEAEPILERVVTMPVAADNQALRLRSIDFLLSRYAALAKYRQREPLLQQALRIAERAEGLESAAAWYRNQLAATYAYTFGRAEEAEQLWLQSLAENERRFGEHAKETLFILLNLLIFYTEQARFDDAERLSSRISGRLADLHSADNPLARAAELRQAQIAVHFGDLQSAKPLLEAAVARVHKLQDSGSPEANKAVILLARVKAKLGDAAGAEELLENELRLLPQRPAFSPDEGALPLLESLAELAAARGDHAAAERAYIQTSSIRMAVRGAEDPGALASNAALIRAMLYQRVRSTAAVEFARELAEGLASQRTRRQRASRFGLPDREAREHAELALLHVDAEWAGGTGAVSRPLPENVFRSLQVATASGVTQSMARAAAAALSKAAGERAAELVRSREAAAEAWQVIQREVRAAHALDGLEGLRRREELEKERVALSRRLEAVDRDIQREFPEYFSLVAEKELAAVELRGLLKPGEALLLVAPGEFGTHAIAMTRDSSAWHRSDWDKDRMRAAVERLRWSAGAQPFGDPEDITRWNSEQPENARPPFDRRTAFEIYNELVAPLAGTLAGNQILYVVAGGSLASLPFSVLVTRIPQGDDDSPVALRDTAWFADEFPLVHLPSVQALELLRRSKAHSPAARSRTFIGIGNPTLSRAEQRRSRRRSVPPAEDFLSANLVSTPAPPSAAANMLRRLPSLPGTGEELEALRRRLGGRRDDLITQGRATEPVVVGTDLSRASIIAFATHGLTPADVVETVAGPRYASEIYDISEPGLVLTPPDAATNSNDGYLAASEVTALRLDADWAILSACNTATGMADDPGLSQLARAFFFAGARNLLASHWPVDDAVAPKITARTIELTTDPLRPLPRAVALQKSMIEVRATTTGNGEVPYAHPFYWAPFVLIGTGRD